ncbi:MAG: hypothetical protein RLZZ241_262 [Bacteroidota bacterium]
MKSFFAHFRGDLFGGITAGIVALPLALAFGVSSGLGPTAGLYGAIFISFFAALFGGTPSQISGPTAPMTAVSMVVVAGVIAQFQGNLNQALPIILAVFLLAGILQIVLGLLGLGKYIRYIPYPVVSGFMTAIGIIILITQILPSIGYYPKEDQEYVSQYQGPARSIILERFLSEELDHGVLTVTSFESALERSNEISPETLEKEAINLAGAEAAGVLGALEILPRALRHINGLELALCLITILIIYGFKRITKTIPSTLVALVGVTGGALLLGLDYRPIEEIPTGFPMPELKIFTQFNLNTIIPYLLTSLSLALLGAIDSLLTSVVADNMTKTRHSPNKELIGQGIGNGVAALFGGIPGAGATIRTVVNINSGGKTRLSGMIAGILLLLTLMVLGPLASTIPAAVLAGILITVGISVMDYRGLRAIRSMPKDVSFGPIKLSSEVIVMFAVMFLSAFWNLVYAVGIGLVLASLMFMKKLGDQLLRYSQVKPLSQEESWPDEINFPENLKEEVFIKHVKGPLFFGSASNFIQLAEQVPENAKAVIIRLGRMTYMDQSGLYALEEVLQKLQAQKILTLLVNIQEQPRYLMENADIIPDLVSEEYTFSSFESCVAWVRNNIADEVH